MQRQSTKFNALVDEVLKLEDNASTRKFHTHEMQYMKRMYSTTKLVAECEAYTKRLNEKVLTLDEETEKMAKMHLAPKDEE